MPTGVRTTSALAVAAFTLAALGLIAAGVQLGRGRLFSDPRHPTAVLSRPAAQLVLPPRPDAGVPALPVVAPALSGVGTLLGLAPGPQPAPAPTPEGAPAPEDGDGEAPIDPGPLPPAPDPGVPDDDVPEAPQPPEPVGGVIGGVVALLDPVATSTPFAL